MAELGTKRRVRLPPDVPPRWVGRRRRSPVILWGLLLWGLAVGVGAIVTLPRARQMEWRRRAVATYTAATAKLRAWTARSARAKPDPPRTAPTVDDTPGVRLHDGDGGEGADDSDSPTVEPVPGMGRPEPAGRVETTGSASADPVAAADDVPPCEAALHAYRNRAMSGADSAPRVTRDANLAALSQGTYLLECEGAYELTVTLCVAAHGDRVVGVSARTEPPQPDVEACLRRVVAALPLEPTLGLDVTEVSFAGR
jgi:hypothetical protein